MPPRSYYHLYVLVMVWPSSRFEVFGSQDNRPQDSGRGYWHIKCSCADKCIQNGRNGSPTGLDYITPVNVKLLLLPISSRVSVSSPTLTLTDMGFKAMR